MTPPTCTDPHCGIHGGLHYRGRTFTGTIIESKAQKTATVEWTQKHYVPKFERLEKRRTHIKVHNPNCINAVKGDQVKIGECRKISKTKSFVILEKLGQDLTYLQREEALDRVDLSKRKKLDEDAAQAEETP